MKTAQADLTTGPLGKQIFRFSIPLIFSNLLQVLFNMADVAVVGRFAGSTALGAVGSTTIFVSLFTGFLIGLSGGVNVLVAHHFGADDQKNLSDTVHSAALTCAAAGLVLLGDRLRLCRRYPQSAEHQTGADGRRCAVPAHLLSGYARTGGLQLWQRRVLRGG